MGERRVTSIINERQTQGQFMLETLKQIQGIPAHIWDSLVSSGRITFETPEEEEKGEELLKKKCWRNLRQKM